MSIPAIRHYTPKVIPKYLHITQDGYAGVIRYHNRNPNVGIRAIVVHVQEGNNWGSWQHFHAVRASSTVLIGRNGDIWLLVHENKAPWTNGDVNRPDLVARSLMNRFGWDPNTWTLTIENEGYTGGLPYTEEQFKSNVWQIAQWLEEYPTIEVVHVIRHGQINSVTRAYCPEGPPYTFMQRISNALAGADQPVEKPTQYVRDPWPVLEPDGTKWDGQQDIVVNGIHFHGDPRTIRVNVSFLNGRQWASTESNLTGTGKANGQAIDVVGWVLGENVGGESRWWVAHDGTRYWVGGTREKPKAPKPQLPDTPDTDQGEDQGNNRDVIPVVVNGELFYPVEARDEGGKPRKEVRFLAHTNVRLWSSTQSYSPVQAVVPAGETRWVTHWVEGETVTLPGWGTSNKWYVLEHESGDGIRKGGRIWSELVEVV